MATPVISPVPARGESSARAQARVERIRDAIPAGGLFHEKEWRISPDPFPLSPGTVAELERLGPVLHRFQRAANLIYRRSLTGTLPGWIASDLDRGKPPELLHHARESFRVNDVPGVIRPDVILTDEGFSITELDSVPGGIGLTDWLNRTWTDLGFENVVGGQGGMTEGFASLFPAGADIVISDEAGDYRPEMEWLRQQLPQDRSWEVARAEEYLPSGRDIYRFFELFDLGNVPFARSLMEAGIREPRVTAPLKPWMEEKMWLALFWSAPLREVWRRELRSGNWRWLQQHIPFGWVMDPGSVPHHAVIPRLEITDFEAMKDFSQRERDLVLKVSGFSEDAWGSRGVFIGSDLSQADWGQVVDRALEDFPRQPWVLQDFHHGRLVQHRWWNEAAGEMQVMKGRVRLCPYYFIPAGLPRAKTRLGGVMATICPEDKKKLHGMSDAIIVPCEVREDGY